MNASADTTFRHAMLAAAPLLLVGSLACGPTIEAVNSAGTSPTRLAEFWQEPKNVRALDLFTGPWDPKHAPDPTAEYLFQKKKAQGGIFNLRGFSPGFTVIGPGGIEWSAKLGPEAQSEVTSSRLVSALGFHQPPVYHLASWTLVGGPEPGTQGPARFRPDLKALDKKGEWSWHQNPFVGTPQWRGLLVFMVMINNSDLKPAQNARYKLDPPRNGVKRWYVARDLGLSLGESGILNPRRNDIERFESERFILGVKEGRVLFNFNSRYPELLEQIRPADVRWTCERLARLTDKQWNDAFRAGGYSPELTARFVKRFREKIAEGLALSGS